MTADSNWYYLPFFVAIGANRFEKKRLALFLFRRQRSKTMIFSDLPSQKSLERMMTQVKGFPPWGSGVTVLRRFESANIISTQKVAVLLHTIIIV